MAFAAFNQQIMSRTQSLGTPITEGARTEDRIRRERPNLYKSFLATRLLVGIVGVLLPTAIIAWDLGTDLLGQRSLGLRGSLSAYYYHPSFLGDWFVGSLWAIGVGLMVYMGTRKSSSAKVISSVAGAAAVVVSLFPTNDGGSPATWVSTLHFGAAAVVIVGLGLLCVGFGVYDNERTDEGTTGSYRKWRGIHYGAAAAIFASVAFVALNSVLDILPHYGVLVGEIVAVYAFSISWFIKGAELRRYTKEHPVDAAGAPLG